MDESVLEDASSSSWDMLEKLQKKVCQIFGPSLSICLQTLATKCSQFKSCLLPVLITVHLITWPKLTKAPVKTPWAYQ